MAVANLQLPSDPRVAAVRGVIAMLKASSDLKRVVRTWRVWDGTTGEGGAAQVGECPWIRVTATPAESGWYASGEHSVHAQPISIQIETVVPGTNVDNSILLWGAIEKAIFGPGMAGLHAIGVSGAEIRQPAWGTVDAAAQMVHGDGTIVLTVYINT